MNNTGKRETDPVRIGKRIQQCRAAAGMTQEQLAEKVGTSQKHLSRIELGYHLPNFETVILLADALDVPVDAFIQDIEENSVNSFLTVIRESVARMSKKQREMLKKEIELILDYDF